MYSPLPSLRFYANDVDDFIRVVAERGVHPTEVEAVVRMLTTLRDETEAAQREAREATDYRTNSDAEELSDLRIELQQAKDRIAVLEDRLHDERRKRK